MKTTKKFSDTITDEQYRKLTGWTINYDRKTYLPDDVRASINLNELHESVREIVSNLPIVEFKNSFLDGILDGDQQFYLMTCKEKIFLIDTQGYNYARNVIQIKDLVVMEKVKPEADTMLMKAHPESVETIIDILKHMEVDGETMEYILDQTGVKGQMLRQLFLKAHKDIIRDLSSERRQLERTI